MINEYWIEKDVEVIGHDLIWDIIQQFAWDTEKTHQKIKPQWPLSRLRF
jgi:hypothetical protein